MHQLWRNWYNICRLCFKENYGSIGMQGKWNVTTFAFWSNFILFQLLGYNSESSRGFPECENMEKIAQHLKFWFQLVGGSLDNVVGWLSKLTRECREYVSSCSYTGCRIPCSYTRYFAAGVHFTLYTSFHIVIINLILNIRSLRFCMTTRTVLGSCSAIPPTRWPSRRRPTSIRCSPSCPSSVDPSASLSDSHFSQSGIWYSC